MGYVVIKEGDKIEIVEEMDFSKDKEEKYLHSLIEQNPELVLKEITDTDVMTLASHLKLPSGGELDLLLIDSVGNLYLVELKRGKGHREAIAQLLDYASDLQQMDESQILEKSGINSLREVFEEFYGSEDEFSFEDFKTSFERALSDPGNINLVLVSYSIGDDVKRLVDWLVRFGLKIFLVDFGYYKTEGKEIFVPKVLTDISTRESKRKSLTEIQKKYISFFSDVLSDFKQQKLGATERGPSYSSYLPIPLGIREIHLVWRFRGKEPNKMLEVGLHFELEDGEKNQKLLEYFVTRRDQIFRNIGEVKFGNIAKDEKCKGIYVEKKVGSLDEALNNPEIKKWAVETMIKFYNAVKESGELDKALQALNQP